MSERRPPISTERARLMLATVQAKLQRLHQPDGDREQLLVAEKLVQAKLRAHTNYPERARQVHEWRIALYHLRRSLGLPQEYPDAATLALALSQAECGDANAHGARDTEGGHSAD